MEYVQAADEGTLFWFGNHHSLAVNAVMEFCTRLGNPAMLFGVAATAITLFLVAGRRRTALVLLLVSLLGPGTSQCLKYVIQRERPQVAWKLIALPHSPSFPSGHAFNTMAIYGALALLASRHLHRFAVRISLLAAGFALPLLIGLSRIYLGVHWPTDVLAGWTAGLACALLALWADQRWGKHEGYKPEASASNNPPSRTLPARQFTGTGGE